MNKYYLVGLTLVAWECYDLIIEEFPNSVRGEIQLRKRLEELKIDWANDEWTVIYGDDVKSQFIEKGEET